MANPNHELYEKDFYSWAIGTSGLLRQHKIDEIDLEDLAEEIESMGISNKRELVSRFRVLIAHLLKWQYQPGSRCKSWRLTLIVQRQDIASLLDESPSLKQAIDLAFAKCYKQAVSIAASETGLDKSTFPVECPFSLKQCLDENFFPE